MMTLTCLAKIISYYSCGPKKHEKIVNVILPLIWIVYICVPIVLKICSKRGNTAPANDANAGVELQQMNRHQQNLQEGLNNAAGNFNNS
jgi:hypothetical protein